MATATTQLNTTDVSSVAEALERPVNTRAALVYIWQNSMTLDSKGRVKFHVGHASMHLYENRHPVRFISWWPETGADPDAAFVEYIDNLVTSIQKLFPKMLAWVGPPAPDPDPGKKNIGLDEDSFSELSNSAQNKLKQGAKPREGQVKLKSGHWVQLPKAFELPGMGAPNRWWGLHLPSIRDWWDNRPPEKYVMISKANNCSGAVATALARGGAESFVAAPVAPVYIVPNDIMFWVQKLMARLLELDANTQWLSDQLKKSNSSDECTLPGPLPSKDEWLKATYLKNKPRSALLHAVDSALDVCYTKVAEGGGISFDIKKQAALVKLVSALYWHASLRPTSERHKLVMCLADRTLSLITAMNSQVEKILPPRPPRPMHFKRDTQYGA
jgi:hypothetical protein